MLEQAQAEAKAAKAEAESIRAQAARETAFAKAGIPDSPLANMFRKSYEGELTAEAIKAQALELGLLQQQQTIPAEERDQILAAQQDPFTPTRTTNPTQLKSIEDMVAKASSNDEIEKILRDNGLYAG